MPGKPPSCAGLSIEQRASGVLHVTLDTPKTLNAFDDARYNELVKCLKYANKEPSVKAFVLSSTGKFFSSGATIAQDKAEAPSSPAKNTGVDASGARKFIHELIDFDKLLIAVVQGPAYGISVTMLPHFDVVYATSSATFTTPFSRLGICLEGCSSVLFPPLFGPAISARLLYLSETVRVDEIAHSGLVAEILPEDGIREAVVGKTEAWLAGLSAESIMASRSLVHSPAYKKMLHRVNDDEMKVLAQRRSSEDHRTYLKRFQDEMKAKRAARSKL